MNETKNEKLDFIKKQDLSYIDNKEFQLDTVFNFAIVKELVAPRLGIDLECFGYFDEQDVACKSCYLAKTNKCQELQRYLKFQKTINPKETIQVKNEKGETLTVESIKEVLDKLKIRESCGTYKIAKAILESDNCIFSDLFAKIQNILGSDKSLAYVKVRFYQVKSLIESNTDIRLNVITQKYLQIGKEIKVDESISKA